MKFNLQLSRLTPNTAPAKTTEGKPSAQGLEVLDPIHHNAQGRVNEFYAKDEVVDKYLDPVRLASYKTVVDNALAKGLIFDDKDVIDVGCGTGHLLLEIQKVSPTARLTGTEYAEEAIKRAKSFGPNINFEFQDVYENWPQQYDVVICSEVIEHLLYPNKAIDTLLSMVRPGGYAVITVPNGRLDNFLGHINFWSPESWKVFIEDAIERHSSQFSSETFTMQEKIKNYALIHRSV